MNLTSICERVETFARTINKHIALNGNWSEQRSSAHLWRARQVTDGDQTTTGKDT